MNNHKSFTIWVYINNHYLGIDVLTDCGLKVTKEILETEYSSLENVIKLMKGSVLQLTTFEDIKFTDNKILKTHSLKQISKHFNIMNFLFEDNKWYVLYFNKNHSFCKSTLKEIFKTKKLI